MGQTTNKSKRENQQYQENLQSKLQETEEETFINQDWQNLKQVTLQAATDLKYLKM